MNDEFIQKYYNSKSAKIMHKAKTRLKYLHSFIIEKKN